MTTKVILIALLLSACGGTVNEQAPAGEPAPAATAARPLVAPPVEAEDGCPDPCSGLEVRLSAPLAKCTLLSCGGTWVARRGCASWTVGPSLDAEAADVVTTYCSIDAL